MRFLKVPPSTIPRRLGNAISMRFHGDGRVTAQKAPRKRGRNLNPLQEQQVALWDEAIFLAKYATGQQVRKARELAAGSGFLARDLLISSCFGHTISWPGWGVYPQGVNSIPQHINSRGVPTYPPRTLGDVQPVNIMTKFGINTIGDPYRVTVETFHPSTPTLLRFCTAPTQIIVYTTRRGQRVPHGWKFFFRLAPKEYQSKNPLGITHVFEPVAEDFAACPHCQFIVVQKSGQPRTDWNSLPIEPCPPGPQGPGHPPMRGRYFAAPAVTFTNHGFPVPPHIFAENTQILNDWIAGATGQGYAIADQGIDQLCVDALWTVPPPQVFAPIDLGPQIGTAVLPLTPGPPALQCIPQPFSGDAHTWWFVIAVP